MKNKVINEFNTWILTQPVHIRNYSKTTATYIRVSTDKQEEYSPISQLKVVWEYCEKHDIYLDPEHIYIEEEGISGKNANKREEFQKMIAVAKADIKPFDTIIVWKFSRFARNLEESIVYKNLLRKKHNIDVISVSEPIPDGPFGELIERIIEWSDEYYITNLSAEVKRGMTEKATKGGLQSIPSFGYNVKDNILIINDSEAEYVKMMFSLYAYDNYSLWDLAQKMYELGVYTKRGKRFENRTIYYILRNPVYIGKIRWTPTGRTKWNFNNPDSIIAEGKHQPIIDIETWNAVQNKLDKNLKFAKPHIQKNKSPHTWLRGLVRCSECGATFIKHGNNSIRCNGYNKGRCSNKTPLNVKDVENLIINQLKNDFTNNLNIKLTETKIKKVSNEKDVLLKQYNNLTTIEQRIKEAYINGIDTLEEYKHNREELDLKRKILKEQIDTMQEEKEPVENRKVIALENGKKLWEILSNENIDIQKKWEVVHFVIEKVIFDEATNQLTLFYN